MADRVLTWTRSDTYVTERQSSGTYHARCGYIDIAGHYFEGFERLGKVALDEGEYPRSSSYFIEGLGYAVNPWHKQMVPDKKDTKTLVRAAILFHPAAVPSALEGCITAGWIYNEKMTDSNATMKTIWQLAGGTATNKSPTITVRVVGARTPWHMGDANKYLVGLKPYTYP